MFLLSSSAVRFFVVVMLLVFIPQASMAASLQIFGESTTGGGAGSSGMVDFSDYATTELVIEVDAYAYAASQNGSGRGGGRALAEIGTLKEEQVVIDGNDPVSVSAFNTISIVKDGIGNWIGTNWNFGPADMGQSVTVSAAAQAGVSDGIDEARVSAWVYWIEASGGTVRVNANIPSAAWVITGPEVITGSGTNAVYTNKPAGVYTITWQPVSGYETPMTATQTLLDNGTLTFPVANYTEIVPTVEVTIENAR